MDTRASITFHVQDSWPQKWLDPTISFIEVPVPSQESVPSYICVLVGSNLLHSTSLCFDFSDRFDGVVFSVFYLYIFFNW